MFNFHLSDQTIVIGTLLVVGIGLTLGVLNYQSHLQNVTQPLPTISQMAQFQPTSAQSVTSTAKIASGEEVIKAFFQHLDEGLVDQALSLMAPQLLETEADQQGWQKHLAAIESATVTEIKPWQPTDWSVDRQIYRVGVKVQISDDAGAPLPNYGWDEGVNWRWLGVVKDQAGNWRISALATGP